ncbi:hypothetical protein [Nesterenkonia xinjiangensis]|uniref:Uncharacterized protein n=2 Tax=Nesterenkonia xinjiangensis TaxID=225327 RepID=A0A7Z0GN88_9MICC|nr:hypothetical protein [Nesterenkonia xinjiangensis]NYJ79015.1 hypothetical protein [Nesterenkonia xinjiangensis]
MMSRRRADRPIVATREMVRRKRRRRAVAVLALVALALAGVVWGTWRYIDEQEFLLDARCEVPVGEDRHTLSPEQAANAALISAMAVDRALPQEAAADALGIALQESDLQMLEATEEQDARELFRRGSPSWSDDDAPAEAAASVKGFYDALESAQDRDEDPWTPELSISEAATALDRPMDPSFYPRHADRGRAFAGPLTGQQPVGMTCHLSRKDAPPADPDGMAHELAELMPGALQVPEDAQAALEARIADEDGESAEDEDADGDAEDAHLDEYGPILIDRAEASDDEADGGPEAGTVVTVTMPGADDEADSDEEAAPTLQRLWTVAHWAVATADVHGTQSVHAGAYQWDRDTGRWARVDEVNDDAVTIGF